VLNVRKGFFRLWIAFSAFWVVATIAVTFGVNFHGTDYFYYVPGGTVSTTHAEQSTASAKGKCLEAVPSLGSEWVKVSDSITIIFPVASDEKRGKKLLFPADCTPGAPPWTWRWVELSDTSANQSFIDSALAHALEERSLKRTKNGLIGIAIAVGVPIALLLVGRLLVWIGRGFREGS
jgi:hypothetical protein